MALPASGQISMDDIRVELGVPTQSPFGLNQARLGTYANINQFSPSKPPSAGQVSLASWYNYCQNCGYNSDSFYYSSASAALACAGTPDTTLYWSGSLALATILYTDSTGTSEASQGYWSNSTNAYFQNCPDGCGDGITSITACAVTSSLFYVQNSSLDIVVNDVKVNGVSLTGVTGTGFPLSTGDTVTGYSNQIGTYDVEILYYNGVSGQHFDVYDSDLTFTCVGTSGTGTNTATIYSAVVGAGTFQIYALDGVC
jgi:hypothetical protein